MASDRHMPIKDAERYSFSDAEADLLKGLILVPRDIRTQALTAYAQVRGAAALVDLFAQFMGVANSVIANNHDALELFGIVQGHVAPWDAEKMNLPTLFGALQGVALARGVKQSKTCGGCAYRLGALANQSPSTTCDAKYVVEDGDKFWCHEQMDAEGNPTKLCAGFAQASRRVGNPGAQTGEQAFIRNAKEAHHTQ